MVQTNQTTSVCIDRTFGYNPSVDDVASGGCGEGGCGGGEGGGGDGDGNYGGGAADGSVKGVEIRRCCSMANLAAAVAVNVHK